MRLKSIKLAGFKSFVDPTKVELLSNRVAIVGPNGCGKSNIIDAVRWVMGESSAKQLRGESLVDVIFNGSTHRPPISQASIELHFDNSDGTLGGAYASYSDIVVRRQVTRDGQSNYSLNGSRCRRKDVTDIFLGTGLGPRSYAIIEQGTISRLIEAKPDELRIFLEEAAGISKYKERRKETENRLSHTRDNLARLNDIRDELAKQIAHLDRQAIAAERFKRLKAEERILKGQLLGLRSRLLKQELLAKQQHITQEQDRLSGLQAEVSLLEAGNSERLDQQEAAQAELNTIQQLYMEQGAAIARLEQSIHHAEQRYQQIHDDLRVLHEQLIATEELQTRDQARLQVLLQEIATLEPQVAETSLSLELVSDQLTTAEQQNHSVQATWDQLNQQLVAATALAQQKQHELQKLEHQHQQVLNQQQRSEAEHSQLTLTLADLQAQQADDTLILLEEQQQEAQNTLQTNQQAIDSARQAVSQARTVVNQWHQHVTSQQAEIKALETFQASALKRSSGLKPETLQSLDIDSTRTLIKELTVEPGFEKAVETILGPWLQALCVTELSQKLVPLRQIAKNPLWLVERQAVNNLATLDFSSGVALRTKVKGPDAILNLLANVYWVEQFTDSTAAIDPAITLINAEGFILKAGLLQMGENATDGVLERQRQLHLKLEQLETAAEQLSQAQQHFSSAELSLAALEQERPHYQQQWQQLSQQLHQQQSVLQIRSAKLQQCADRLQGLNSQIHQASIDAAELMQAHDQLRDAWQVALTDLESLNLQRADALQNRDNERDQLQQVRSQWQTIQQQVHHLNLQQQKCVSEKAALEQQLLRSEQQLQQLTDRNVSLSATKLEVLEPIPLLKEQVEHLLEQRFSQEQSLTAAKIAVQTLADQFRHSELQRRESEQSVETQRLNVETARLAAETLSGRLQSIHEQMVEAELDADTLEAELPDDCSESVLQQQLDELAQKISRLGLVNLAAIEEFTAQSARKAYLDTQHDDLVEAMTILENAIRTIDRETKARFSETFDQVNQNFQKLFPQVFAGGKAYLDLTGDDLLSTGVAVFAQPPGKRNSTIHLLSGGEKALTAVALVFAIFQINPAPFCMLDEVDAPLDDANVARFCHLVNLMADKTQFIMVTHNKVAMEMADQLMGVTMQEPGVSRLVAVDMNAALAIVGE